eukprot:Gb_32413 [translate_table: standard]
MLGSNKGSKGNLEQEISVKEVLEENRVENPPIEPREMPLRRNRQREAGGPVEFEREANQDRSNLNRLWHELESPKFARKDDGMDIPIKIREIRSSKQGSYEKEGELGAFVPFPSNATKQANLFVPISNGVLPKPTSSLVSIGQVLESTLAKQTIDALDEFLEVEVLYSFNKLSLHLLEFKYNTQHNSQVQFFGTTAILVVTYHALPPRTVASRATLKICVAYASTIANSNGESFAWFPKTLWFDDHKSVNCDDGQSVLTIYTMAFDPRGINYDSPFVLTVGTMVIDARVYDLRVPTLGTMVVSTIAIDSNISDLDMYRYLEEEGQRIKVKLIGLEVFFLEGLYGEITSSRVGIDFQPPPVFPVEDAGIFNDRGMVMSAYGGVLQELPHERNFIPINHPPTTKDIDT